LSPDPVIPNENGPESSAGGLSDEELLKAFLGGQERAFEELFERYRDRIFGYLIRLVRDRSLAEELFQEVFLHLFRRASRFDASRTFRSWFFRVAHNRAVDFLRRGERSGNFEELREDVTETKQEVSPEQMVLEAESARFLDQSLYRLSDDHRSVLLLKFKEGLTYEEIAEVVGCPVGTAKSRTHHALRQLRELIGKEK
jgi:RNA polymerase sigma-70 factor (ECF subfamily)